MKVQRRDPVGSAREIERKERADKPAPAAPTRPAAGDRIEWSPQANELARIREAALAAPDVRAGLVERLRDEIENGRYQPDVRDLARRVLEDLRAFRNA